MYIATHPAHCPCLNFSPGPGLSQAGVNPTLSQPRGARYQGLEFLGPGARELEPGRTAPVPESGPPDPKN